MAAAKGVWLSAERRTQSPRPLKRVRSPMRELKRPMSPGRNVAIDGDSLRKEKSLAAPPRSPPRWISHASREQRTRLLFPRMGAGKVACFISAQDLGKFGSLKLRLTAPSSSSSPAQRPQRESQPGLRRASSLPGVSANRFCSAASRLPPVEDFSETSKPRRDANAADAVNSWERFSRVLCGFHSSRRGFCSLGCKASHSGAEERARAVKSAPPTAGHRAFSFCLRGFPLRRASKNGGDGESAFRPYSSESSEALPAAVACFVDNLWIKRGEDWCTSTSIHAEASALASFADP